LTVISAEASSNTNTPLFSTSESMNETNSLQKVKTEMNKEKETKMKNLKKKRKKRKKRKQRKQRKKSDQKRERENNHRIQLTNSLARLLPELRLQMAR